MHYNAERRNAADYINIRILQRLPIGVQRTSVNLHFKRHVHSYWNSKV